MVETSDLDSGPAQQFVTAIHRTLAGDEEREAMFALRCPARWAVP
jgi:hypothetical protein